MWPGRRSRDGWLNACAKDGRLCDAAAVFECRTDIAHAAVINDGDDDDDDGEGEEGGRTGREGEAGRAEAVDEEGRLIL